MEKRIYPTIKNILDKVIALVLIIPAGIMCILLGIFIKLDSKGKILFKHKRVGKNGRTIYVYKLRTMVENAEKLKEQFTEEQKREFSKNYKLKTDPRITRIGRILRRLSLDELPQLLNVLKGDLSIVGPRPVTKDEVDLYGTKKESLLKIKPGIVGAWTANGRSTTSYEERQNLELWYTENVTFCNDVKILCKTLLAVMKRKGAM